MPTLRRAAVLLCLALPASAQEVKLTETVLNMQKVKVIQSVKFAGDLRLRDEDFSKRTAGQANRHRERYRLRVGMELGLLNDFLVGLRLASGTGEQVSTNQTLGNVSSGKGIFVDQVYLRWAPFLGDNGKVHLSAGKMPNPFWRPYSADAIWDDDLNPEGLSEGVEWFLPIGMTVFANALQMPVAETSSSQADPWLFSQQAGAEFRLPMRSRFKVAGALHGWTRMRTNALGQTATNEGNRRTAAGLLQNDFTVAEVTGELSTWLGGLPLSGQLTWLKNTAPFQVKTGGDRADYGYQAGAILGKAKEAKTWELAYFYKWLETDATPADVADSDFGDGGTNRRGHILWAAYSPKDWMQLKAKYFMTRVVNEALAPGADDINRLQLDFSVKF